MDPNLIQARKVFEARILARASDDPAFRERLLKNPIAAFEEEIGRPFPRTLKVQVLEEPVDTLTLVVPAAPLPGGELSDAQLDGVAGGSLWTDIKQFLGGGKFEVSTEKAAVAGVRG
jgi:hypothetical protein